MMKVIALILLLIFTNLARATENQAGFVDIAQERGYILFPRLQPLTSFIFIQWEDKHDRIRCCFRIKREELEKINYTRTFDEGIRIYNLRIHDLSVPNYVAYKFKAKYPLASPAGFVGMAIAADKVTVYSPNLLLARTNGKQMSARLCYGQEGVNLIAKEGKKYELMYYQFGAEIDIDPKCATRDTDILNSAKPYHK